MKTFPFNISGVVSAPGLAFRSAGIKSGVFSLMTGYLLFIVLGGIGLVLSGYNPFSVWLLPSGFPTVPPLTLYSPIGAIFLIAGFMLFVYSIFSGMTAISRMAFETLAGNPFLTFHASISFAARRKNSVFGIPAIMILAIILSSASVSLVGWLGRIPMAGSILVALFFIPGIIMSLMMIYFFIMFFIVILFMPAIIGVTDDAAPEILAQLFSIFLKKPLALIVYQVIAILVYIVSFSISGLILLVAVKTAFVLVYGGMGPRFAMLGSGIYQFVHNAFYFHPLLGKLEIVYYWMLPRGVIPFLSFGLPVSAGIASYIMFLILGMGLVVLLAYWMSLVAGGQVIIYLILRKSMDGVDLIQVQREKSKLPQLQL